VDVGVDVVVVSVSSGTSVMEMVEVRIKAQDPCVVDVVAVTEQPDSTTLVMVVHEDEPGAAVVQDTTKSVTVAVEQLVVFEVASSVASQPRTGTHVEMDWVVDGPTDCVSTQAEAVSVLQLVGSDEYVGWPSLPTVMAGHDGRMPMRLMPGGRLIFGSGGGPLLREVSKVYYQMVQKCT
jgi:hypothetical protein